MVSPHGVYIALGSNLGDRHALLLSALQALQNHPAIRVLQVSNFHQTEPVGGPPNQPTFLNAAAQLDTQLQPHDLLNALLHIENQHGRRRTVPNGPRTLDLDLLLYHDRRIDTPQLVVPHPRMWQRPFVMIPLRQICPHDTLAKLQPQTASPHTDTAT